MANVLHKTADPVDYRLSANTPDFPTADWFINPDVSAVAGVPTKYWARPLTDPVTEMSQAEKDAVDSSIASAIVSEQRQDAKDHQDGTDGDMRSARAIVKLTVDELNILRSWLVDFKAAVASSNNLSQLQTEVAALPNTLDRTYAQARSAIDIIIDAE